MAGPMRLRSWWEVAFLLAFVFIVGMSEISPFWKRWGGPVLAGIFVVVVAALVFSGAGE